MKHRGHLLCMLLAAILLLSLISCDPKGNDTADTSEETEEASTAMSDVTTAPEEETTKKPAQQTTQKPSQTTNTPEDTDEPQGTDESNGTTSAPDAPTAPPVNTKLTPHESGEGDVLSWADGTAESEENA